MYDSINKKMFSENIFAFSKKVEENKSLVDRMDDLVQNNPLIYNTGTVTSLLKSAMVSDDESYKRKILLHCKKLLQDVTVLLEEELKE